MILFIKHIDIEGPETLGRFFKEKGFSSRTIEVHAGETLPEDLSDIEAVVSLGGPMNVYEEDKYAFLRPENTFIQKVLQAQIPFMGVCLGSQLLTKAAGGEVTKSPEREVGWFDVDLSDEGKRDPLFEGLSETFLVYQWHEDMCRIPEGAVLLAGSERCPVQAFRIGQRAYGLQFHVEITDTSIREWSDAYRPGKSKARDEMLEGYRRAKAVFDENARKMFTNFEKICRSVSL